MSDMRMWKVSIWSKDSDLIALLGVEAESSGKAIDQIIDSLEQRGWDMDEIGSADAQEVQS